MRELIHYALSGFSIGFGFFGGAILILMICTAIGFMYEIVSALMNKAFSSYEIYRKIRRAWQKSNS